VRPGEKAPRADASSDVVRLTRHDFDRVVADPAPGRLRVVKLGAIWCPPCRLMDGAMAAIARERTLPEVDFFEVDIDEEHELAQRFPNQAIPYTLFFYAGRRLEVKSDRLETIEGGVQGGLRRLELEKLCRAALAAGKAGARVVALP
jgi:thiol-disulfide isomerase/thioredoxin